MDKNSFPLVSIIIPVLNRRELISETLSSVYHQTYLNWEIIIVDDGSTDGTWEYISQESKKNTQLKAIRRDSKKKGLGICRNLGIQQAKGKYLVFLDSDDLLDGSCLENRINKFKNYPDLDFLVFGHQHFHSKPGDLSSAIDLFSSDDLDSFLDEKTPWLTPCCIWKKDKIKEIGGFNEDLLNWLNWEVHVRALAKGLRYKKFTQIDCYVREHDGNRMTGADKNNLPLFKERLSRRENMFKQTFFLLKENMQHTKSRRKKMARLFFVTALQWLRVRETTQCLTCWKFVKEVSMVSFCKYYCIRLSLQSRISVMGIEKAPGFSMLTKWVYKVFKRVFFT